MKCYTVAEEVKPGIRVMLDTEKGEAYIPVGEKRFPVSRTIRDGMAEILHDASAAIKADELSEKEREALQEMVDSKWFHLNDGDIPPESDRICNPHPIVERGSEGWNARQQMLVQKRSCCAIVLVVAQPGVNGALRLTSRAYEEVQDTEYSHVRRVYLPWPVPGIKELISDSDNWCKLLVLSPRSGFRIDRTGELDGAAPVIEVNWTGSDLRLRNFYLNDRNRRNFRNPRAA